MREENKVVKKEGIKFLRKLWKISSDKSRQNLSLGKKKGNLFSSDYSDETCDWFSGFSLKGRKFPTMVITKVNVLLFPRVWLGLNLN